MVHWQCYKDPMHAYDHGVAMHITQAIVKTIHKLEVDLGLPKNTLMNRLTARMHNLCSSLETKHTTLMGFTHQSIVTLFETLSTPGKKGQKQSPIVDAGDVQKLMLTLPFLLDGLADAELEAHNSACGALARIADPIPEACMAINEWLHWYKLYRTPEPDAGDVARLTGMGKALLSTLERVFPFKVRMGKVTLRSMWCNEKVHSILHGPRTLVRMGRSQNVCCQVTETSHKEVKKKGSRTNRNPATSGMSIMKAQLRTSACQRMADALDESGNFAYLYVYVHIMYVCVCTKSTCIIYLHVFECIRMYHCVSVCKCDLIAGEQGPAGTSAGVPNQQGTLERDLHLLIPILTMFCPLHAIGRTRNQKRRKAAWPQGCAAACGRARNPRGPLP
jgi:hypothetical protein